MDFSPITLEDRDVFERFLAGRDYSLGTYDFNNLYMWRNWDPYLYTVLDQALVVRSDYFGPPSVLVPITPRDEILLSSVEKLLHWFKQNHNCFSMCDVSEDARRLLEQTWPGRFLFMEFPPGANYVYRQSDLAQLPGRNFNSKRNHVHHFERNCPGYEFLPITPQLVPACVELQQRWYAAHAKNGEVEFEHAGVLDALYHLDKLSCTGAVLMWQGRAVAFTVGGPLNSTTASIHIEKADPQVQGAFQAINCFFVREYCAWAEFINRAEDMGDPGLRRAKQSYHPCRMEKKYFAKLR